VQLATSPLNKIIDLNRRHKLQMQLYLNKLAIPELLKSTPLLKTGWY